MSHDTGYTPRHNPAGKYEHTCPYCHVIWRSNGKADKYCCFAHKSQASNKRFYSAHRREIILSVTLRRYRGKTVAKKKSGNASQVQQPDFEAMTPDELLEFVRNNPHSFRVKAR